MGWTLVALVVGAGVGAIATHLWWRRRIATTGQPQREQLAAAQQRVAAMEQAQQELTAALDVLPAGVVLVDAEGRLLARNRQAEHFLGITYLDALVDEAVESHLEDALAGHERIDTLEVYGPPRRTLVVRGSVVTVGGRQVGAMSTIEDASERVRLDSVRTDLVANISHELKTPVGAIALLAETLADEDEPEVIARLAPKLIAEAHRLSRIIDELLELSRIELGGQALNEVVDLAAVAREAVALHAPLAAARGIPVRLEASIRPRVLGNRRQLLSAVGNLVENAIKYSDPDAAVDIDVHAEGDQVVLAVHDHGIGIPGRDLDRVFERFYRVDKARSRETGGSGLGLSIVRHVMANHGGQVAVASVEGEGSTFTLRVPLASTTAGAAPDIAQAG
jgi:two-component system, OmpR family, sensor histidine kinase SenX3